MDQFNITYQIKLRRASSKGKLLRIKHKKQENEKYRREEKRYKVYSKIVYFAFNWSPRFRGEKG